MQRRHAQPCRTSPATHDVFNGTLIRLSICRWLSPSLYVSTLSVCLSPVICRCLLRSVYVARCLPVCLASFSPIFPNSPIICRIISSPAPSIAAASCPSISAPLCTRKRKHAANKARNDKVTDPPYWTNATRTSECSQITSRATTRLAHRDVCDNYQCDGGNMRRKSRKKQAGKYQDAHGNPRTAGMSPFRRQQLLVRDISPPRGATPPPPSSVVHADTTKFLL